MLMKSAGFLFLFQLLLLQRFPPSGTCTLRRKTPAVLNSLLRRCFFQVNADCSLFFSLPSNVIFSLTPRHHFRCGSLAVLRGNPSFSVVVQMETISVRHGAPLQEPASFSPISHFFLASPLLFFFFKSFCGHRTFLGIRSRTSKPHHPPKRNSKNLPFCPFLRLGIRAQLFFLHVSQDGPAGARVPLSDHVAVLLPWVFHTLSGTSFPPGYLASSPHLWCVLKYKFLGFFLL